MTPSVFEAVARGCAVLPPVSSAPLLGLWWNRRGDRERAHAAAAADEEGRAAAGVHADRPRHEGDFGNARYGYRRAGRPMPATGLDAE